MIMNSIVTTVPENGGKAPDSILWMPEGEHDISANVNGAPKKIKVILDKDCLPLLQADLAAKLNKEVKPVGYYMHKEGAASYNPVSFEWEDGKGVILKLDWTSGGRASVEGRDYAYHSPKFIVDQGTRRVVGLVPESPEVGSLVNNPAFESIERISAGRAYVNDSDGKDEEKDENLAHQLGIDNSGTNRENKDLEKHDPTDTEGSKGENSKGNIMDINKLISLGIITEDEAKEENAEATALERIDALGKECKKNSDELEASRKEIDGYKSQVEESKKEKEKQAEKKVSEAVSAGRIKPKDEKTKEFWKNNLVVDYVMASSQLDSLPVDDAFERVDAGKKDPDAMKVDPIDSLAKRYEDELNN